VSNSFSIRKPDHVSTDHGERDYNERKTTLFNEAIWTVVKKVIQGGSDQGMRGKALRDRQNRPQGFRRELPRREAVRRVDEQAAR
jgi:hypothetical protein